MTNEAPKASEGIVKEGFCIDIEGYDFVRYDPITNTAYYIAIPTPQWVTIEIGFTTN